MSNVQILADDITIEGELVIPNEARGLIIFAHGSGSSRHSPRNKYVAQNLQKGNLATLLIDLLSEEEDTDQSQRFNTTLLAARLTAVIDWAVENNSTASLSIGLFGASTGAAAALLAAATSDKTIKALVSRGGRVDLASNVAPTLNMPILCIVGEKDREVLSANQNFCQNLSCEHNLVIIPEASHLFEEPGTLDQVAKHALKWFTDHL